MYQLPKYTYHTFRTRLSFIRGFIAPVSTLNAPEWVLNIFQVTYLDCIIFKGWSLMVHISLLNLNNMKSLE